MPLRRRMRFLFSIALFRITGLLHRLEVGYAAGAREMGAPRNPTYLVDFKSDLQEGMDDCFDV